MFIKEKPLLPSMQTFSSQTDEFIRHRLSDMYLSQHRQQDMTTSSKMIPSLEPTTQQPYFENSSFSRRGSVTDPHGYRRPSVTELNNLPLLNSTVVSRRGSIATTDYDYSSRSPSPSPFSTTKRYHENDASAPHPYALNNGRRDSLPNNNMLPAVHNNVYDPFQRRHSIATAEPPYNHNTNRNNSNTTTTTTTTSTTNTNSPLKYKCWYFTFFMRSVKIHILYHI